MAKNGNPFGLWHSTPEGKSIRDKFKNTNREKLLESYVKSWSNYNRPREDIIKSTYK